MSQRVINRWNSLSEEDVDAESNNSFKGRLEKRHARQIDFFKDLKSTSPIGGKEEEVHQDEMTVPGAASPGKYSSDIFQHPG